MRSLAHVLLLCVVCLAPVASPAQDRYLCTKVLDGDTIDLESVGRVRLIGVDCPELGQKVNGYQGFSAEASEYTRSLVEGKRVRLEYDRERRDKFGRTLAYVYLEDGSFVNALIVEQGYGWAYTRFRFRHADLFRRLESEARSAKRGLWGIGASAGGLNLGAVSRDLGVRADSTNPETVVYVTRTGKKYHVEGCRSLARSMIPISLAEAVLRYGPCGICSPPTLRGGGVPGIRGEGVERTRRAGTARCQALTKKGTQCKRNARAGSSYCWQHDR
ncbi:MAG TPA: thermonuclease family protein [Candidatus Eisenbacteria bacterium]|nr:thermonuclease family protein [Candidatus Eisenbacteria bacterium]